MQYKIYISINALNLLKSHKREHYSLKRLATEAIEKVYGGGGSVVAAERSGGKFTDAQATTFAESLLKEFSAKEALQKLHGYLPTNPEFREMVQQKLLEAL